MRKNKGGAIAAWLIVIAIIAVIGIVKFTGSDSINILGGNTPAPTEQAATPTPTPVPTPTPTPTPTPEPTPIVIDIGSVGDFMVHGPQLSSAYQSDGTYYFDDCLEPIRELVSSVDLAIANYETTVSNDEKGYTSYPMFRSPESTLTALKNCGFDLLGTANNHSLDNNVWGVTNTVEKIREYGFYQTGTARTLEEREEPLVIDVNGINVGVMAYTYGANGLEGYVPADQGYMINYNSETEEITAEIGRLNDAGSDIIVAMIHWGNEYWREPDETQTQFAQWLFEQGVDVILGSHPHVLEPMQTFEVNGEKKFVIYSLGNFISNQNDKYTDAGVFVDITIQKDLMTDITTIEEVTYLPLWRRRYYNEDGEYKFQVLMADDTDYPGLSESEIAAMNLLYSESIEQLTLYESFDLIEGHYAIN